MDAGLETAPTQMLHCQAAGTDTAWVNSLSVLDGQHNVAAGINPAHPDNPVIALWKLRTSTMRCWSLHTYLHSLLQHQKKTKVQNSRLSPGWICVAHITQLYSFPTSLILRDLRFYPLLNVHDRKYLGLLPGLPHLSSL